ncbi:hypothetical protein O3M35_009881 [Rhynocoris fuscipes]|uniref:Uncharacterized protein n=1 Tax=Rhynocoris fuscipes TaxID=488301 RepID=A0AAW1D632_9HEMI
MNDNSRTSEWILMIFFLDDRMGKVRSVVCNSHDLIEAAKNMIQPISQETNQNSFKNALLKSSLDVLRGSYLLARDSVVPRDVFLKGRTGFGHSSICSDEHASEARTKLVEEQWRCLKEKQN